MELPREPSPEPSPDEIPVAGRKPRIEQKATQLAGAKQGIANNATRVFEHPEIKEKSGCGSKRAESLQKQGGGTSSKPTRDRVHPNVEKIQFLVGSFGVCHQKRMHIRDAISYARALKSGGAILRHKASREEAIGKILRWNRRRSARKRLQHSEVETIVDFVYGDPGL